MKGSRQTIEGVKVKGHSADTKTTNYPLDSGKERLVTTWRKVLYEDLGYPDNYVDKSFLEEMKKNRKEFHKFV